MKRLLYELIGPLLAIILIATVVVGLLGCGSGGGWTLPWSRSEAGGVPPVADPFGSLWWIAPVGVMSGIAMIGLLGMRREGVMTILASIALAAVLFWLKTNLTTVLLLGAAGVAAYLLGNGQERLAALRGAWKLRAEGKDAESTALLRQALPWVDATYRRQAKRRAKSGTIKPEIKP